MRDILQDAPKNDQGMSYIQCLDKGFVGLVDVMPRLVREGQTCDHAIVEAARVSYGDGTRTVNEDRGLIRYLFRHQHSTPTEMIRFKFHCKMPIFVARQWVRHRMASLNEVSGRYSVLKDEFFIPEPVDIRQQSAANKQASLGVVDELDAGAFVGYLETMCREAYEGYEAALRAGVGREMARIGLPLNLYTEWYWMSDAHNLFHFLALRCDSHAQKEIRVFADAMLALVTPLMPWAVEAWNDYHPLRGAIKLSRLEVERLKGIISNHFDTAINLESGNKREDEEWLVKARRIGLIDT